MSIQNKPKWFQYFDIMVQLHLFLVVGAILLILVSFIIGRFDLYSNFFQMNFIYIWIFLATYLIISILILIGMRRNKTFTIYVSYIYILLNIILTLFIMLRYKLFSKHLVNIFIVQPLDLIFTSFLVFMIYKNRYYFENDVILENHNKK
jgi:hypothetical protein